MTQTMLATKLHKPQSFVSKFENAERRLDVLEFLRICRLLGVDLNTITAVLQDDYTPVAITTQLTNPQ